LEEVKTVMARINAAKPFPSDENLAAGGAEVARLKSAITEVKQRFAPIPFDPGIGSAFKDALEKTIYSLTLQATNNRIGLPSNPYFFSFAAQKQKLDLDTDGYPAINRQVADVKAIVELLFDAKIHSLMGLMRVPVSKDDSLGSNDILAKDRTQTNQVTGATLMPYEVSFSCFSGDLANVLDSLTASKYGFVVQGVAIDRMPDQSQLPVLRPKTPVAPVISAENRTIFNEERFLAVLRLGVVRPVAETNAVEAPVGAPRSPGAPAPPGGTAPPAAPTPPGAPVP
jgi:hypothetical protein